MNIGLLKHKDFRLLMLGKFVSLLGSRMQSFALSLYVLKATGSPAKFASVLAISIIPQIILGPIAGVFVDWLDRKKIIVYLDLFSGILVGIYAFVYRINGGLSLIHIYILVIMLSIISIIFGPAITTVIPSIIKKDNLVDANGINSFIRQIGNLIAPAVAGMFMGLYGLGFVLFVNSISFILSSISEMFINIPKFIKENKKVNIESFKSDFKEGIQFIKGKRKILSIIFLGIVINFAYSPVISIGVTYISKQILLVSDTQYGLLSSIIVMGMMLAPFICSIASRKIDLGMMIFLDIFIISILFGIMAFISSKYFLNLIEGNLIPFIMFTIVCAIIAIVTSTGNIAIGTMMQKEIPLDLMGRVNSVISTGLTATIPLGQMIYGVLFENLQAWVCITISATILLVTILLSKRNLSSTEYQTSGQINDNPKMVSE